MTAVWQSPYSHLMVEVQALCELAVPCAFPFGMIVMEVMGCKKLVAFSCNVPNHALLWFMLVAVKVFVLGLLSRLL